MVEQKIKKDDNSHWAFDEIMDIESKHGFTSTFFFAARNKLDQHANYKYDVPYNIEDVEFIRLLENMNNRKFEIGLHISYFAKKDVKYIIEEKIKLERIAGRSILGARHHFWQIGENEERTLEMHVNAGLKYDSSIAFNDTPGYRRNVALAFYPFNKETQTRVNNL